MFWLPITGMKKASKSQAAEGGENAAISVSKFDTETDISSLLQ